MGKGNVGKGLEKSKRTWEKTGYTLDIGTHLYYTLAGNMQAC